MNKTELITQTVNLGVQNGLSKIGFRFKVMTHLKTIC